MTVQELMDLLTKCNPDAEVVLSSDSEGNDYSPAASFDDHMVYDDGAVYFAELDKDLEALGYTVDDCWDPDNGDGTPCVVLWPS